MTEQEIAKLMNVPFKELAVFCQDPDKLSKEGEMNTYKECRFYIEGGKCSHKDAPEPGHSYCIGKDWCEVWRDDIECEVAKAEGK